MRSLAKFISSDPGVISDEQVDIPAFLVSLSVGLGLGILPPRRELMGANRM
jgi:hypothetical protein